MPELIGRELAEALDELIKLRVREHEKCKHGDDHFIYREEGELLIRKITDALLAMDSRRGIYVSGRPIPGVENGLPFQA
jgi:hypothetical protein